MVVPKVSSNLPTFINKAASETSDLCHLFALNGHNLNFVANALCRMTGINITYFECTENSRNTILILEFYINMFYVIQRKCNGFIILFYIG